MPPPEKLSATLRRMWMLVRGETKLICAAALFMVSAVPDTLTILHGHGRYNTWLQRFSPLQDHKLFAVICHRLWRRWQSCSYHTMCRRPSLQLPTNCPRQHSTPT